MVIASIKVDRKENIQLEKTLDILPKTPPLVIAGTGGSGTRVVRDLLEKSGVFMGLRESAAGDAHAFVPFFEHYIPELLRHTQTIDYTQSSIGRSFWMELRNAFVDCLEKFVLPIETAPLLWGWKNPRAIYFLPIIHDIFPDFTFFHMVRDGRAMALSKNQNQAKKYYELLYGNGIDNISLCSGRMWSDINCSVRLWAEKTLPDKYEIIRFEDLCRNPDRVCGKLEKCLNLEIPDSARKLIKSPSTLERWKDISIHDLNDIEKACRTGLLDFQYL